MDSTQTTDPFTRPKRPWEYLPPETLAVLEPAQQPISDAIVVALVREVPAYTRALSGAFGDTVREGVEQALIQFTEMVRTPGTSREEGRRLYVALGRGELRAGRSIGALLAAYRLGAQVAWRELAAAGLKAGLPQETLNLLAESIFAYIDELSAESAEGYALEQAERAGELDVRRATLIDLMIREKPAADIHSLSAAADVAAWRVPEQIAVVVWRVELGRDPAARLPQDSIVSSTEGLFCAIVPDPDGPGRAGQLERGLASIPSAIGPTTGTLQAARGFRRAQAALQLGEARGALGLTRAGEHRVELLCRGDDELVREILEERLAPLAQETANSRSRLRETLLAWLRHDGDVPAAALELHVHAQTVRYRMARLRELLGDALDEPDIRFELE
ncbi:MAG: helix-turn-helix domain-containing protein, partial [Solirubrobacterales bacterium]